MSRDDITRKERREKKEEKRKKRKGKKKAVASRKVSHQQVFRGLWIEKEKNIDSITDHHFHVFSLTDTNSCQLVWWKEFLFMTSHLMSCVFRLIDCYPSSIETREVKPKFRQVSHQTWNSFFRLHSWLQQE